MGAANASRHARFRAALALAESSPPDLGATLTKQGYKLGKDTLYAIHAGDRPLYDKDIEPIADALELPQAFFTADLWLLEARAKEENVDARLSALEEEVRGLRDVRDYVRSLTPETSEPANEVREPTAPAQDDPHTRAAGDPPPAQ